MKSTVPSGEWWGHSVHGLLQLTWTLTYFLIDGSKIDGYKFASFFSSIPHDRWYLRKVDVIEIVLIVLFSFLFVLAVCKPGYYSTNGGVEPCVECPIGTYQENEQHTQCSTCPAGTNTTSSGSASQDDCLCEYNISTWCAFFQATRSKLMPRKCNALVLSSHRRKRQGHEEMECILENSLSLAKTCSSRSKNRGMEHCQIHSLWPLDWVKCCIEKRRPERLGHNFVPSSKWDI